MVEGDIRTDLLWVQLVRVFRNSSTYAPVVVNGPSGARRTARDAGCSFVVSTPSGGE